MGEIADRYRRIAAQFSQRVDGVPDERWDDPAPPEGWVARDVVGHLTSWLPDYFFETWDLGAERPPDAAVDPVAAWHSLDRTIQAALDDPDVAGRRRDTRMGDQSFEDQIDMICTPDVMMHTWDLARATGQDETLDAAEVHRFVGAMEPMDELLRTSGHYGPRVPVPDDADEQTRMIGFIGRTP
ncbi:MAG: hypothetical protein JWO77_2148 [Ilumatobacteraceae bacterium]|nr:hypothetical protein [Ilumatobacteraceae bacterium]